MNLNASGRVTLKDIAERCGYTANTVSRALRNDEKLPEHTRQTIQQLARKMGYVPNRSARALRYGSSRTVAVIINELNNPYYANLLSQIEQELRARHYHAMILCVQLDEELADDMIQLAISQQVDGILFFPFSNERHIRELHESGIPFVLIDRWIPGAQADIARIDDFGGGYALTRHLVDLGHREFLYMAGPFVNSSQIDRQSGIAKAMEEAGVDPEKHMRVIAWDDIPEDATPEDVAPLLEPYDYTAIVAFNDVLAYHALNALNAQGMRVPEDISLVGFDHIRWRNTYLPPLTSIAAAEKGVASAAIEMLFERMENPGLSFRHRVMPVRIHMDGTTQAVQK